MPHVKMRTTGAGPEGPLPAGATVGVSDESAAALLEGGYAEAVNTPEPEREAAEGEPEEAPETEPEEAAAGEPETATAEPPENAAKPRPQRRKAG